MKIAIAVPVYRATYEGLSKLLDSIDDNNIVDYEILLIFDGENGNEQILESDLLTNSHVRYIVQRHAGVSAARNRAIQEVNADWLMFCDADDYLLPHAIDSLVECGEKNKAEIVFSNHIRQYGKRKEKYSYFKKEKIFSREEALECVNDILSAGSDQGAVWGKIFNVSFLKKSRVAFNTELVNGEDQEYMVQLAFEKPIVAYCSVFTYVYVVNSNSSVHSFDPLYVKKTLLTISSIEHVIVQNDQMMNYVKCFTNYLYDRIILIMINYVFNPHNNTVEQKLLFSNVFQNAIFKNVLNKKESFSSLKNNLGLSRAILIFVLQRRNFIFSKFIIWVRLLIHVVKR